jgi:L-threonylcarbamoyladenylate synthase
LHAAGVLPLFGFARRKVRIHRTKSRLPSDAPILPAPHAQAEALRLLEAGALVAVPTETVYGLAADAGNGAAVAAIFEAKGRPSFNPLIVHVSDLAMAEGVARLDPLSRRLAERFWPGPLTLVVPLREGAPVHPLALAGLSTVALRRPRGFAGELIAAFGRPLAAPSANPSGRLSATTAEAVQGGLGGRVGLIVDGGPSPVGLESTIVKADGERLFVLRPGGLTSAELEAAAGVRPERAGGTVEAPGMLASHYAPGALLRLEAQAVSRGEALLAFGPTRARGAEQALLALNLSAEGDLREAAANLFSHLKRLDEAAPAAIAVEPVPSTGLGEAINDRLRRAAAPRDVPGSPGRNRL